MSLLKPLLPIVLGLLFLAPGLPPASAQVLPDAGATEAEAEQAADDGRLTRAEIETLLATLKDDARREEFVANLEGMLRALEEAPPPEPTATTALSDLVGATGDVLGELVHRLSEAAIALTNVNALMPAIYAFAQEPGALLDLGKWLAAIAAVLAAALVAAMLVGRALRRWTERVDAWTAAATYARSLLALPAALLLAVLPAVTFMVVGQGILSVVPFDREIDVAARILLLAVALSLLAHAVLRVVLAQRGPIARGFRLAEETVAYLQVWGRRLIDFGIYGVFGLETALVLGLPYDSYFFLLQIVYAVLWGLAVLIVLQNRKPVADAIRNSGGVTKSRALVGMLAAVWHILAIAYLTAGLLILLSGLQEGFLTLAANTALMAVILVLWRVLLAAIDRAVAHGFSISEELKAQYPSLERRANRHIPTLVFIAKALLAIVAIASLLDVWGFGVAEYLATTPGQRLLQAVITVIVVTIAALTLSEMSALLIERRLAAMEAEGASAGRARTLMPLVRNAAMILVFVLGGLIVLSEIGIDITPLLAGAGVIGLAIGFGAQALVRDVISGLFLLFEDTLNVGDFVDAGGKMGTVEGLSIRALRLRDPFGNVHTIPFGSVELITNMTKEYGYSVVDVGVAYREDADEVMRVLGEVGAELREDETHGPNVLEDMQIFGVQDLGDSAVTIRVRFKTVAGTQWGIRREMLRRVKRRFDQEGIEIPYPHQTLYFGADKDGSAPVAHVEVEQVTKRRGAKDASDGEPPAEAPAPVVISNPEMADGEAAREKARTAKLSDEEAAAEPPAEPEETPKPPR